MEGNTFKEKSKRCQSESVRVCVGEQLSVICDQFGGTHLDLCTCQHCRHSIQSRDTDERNEYIGISVIEITCEPAES